MAKQLVFFLIFSFFLLETHAQVYHYDIYRNENTSIGTIKTTRIQNGSITRIKADTHVSFRLLFKVDLVYLFNTTFTDGLFSKADTKNTANGNVQEYSKINWDGVKYQAEINDKKKNIHLARAKYTILSMYYEEPINKTKVFSERFATYCALRPLGNQIYEVSLPNGNKNQYKYKNGKCTEITANTSLATLKFKLRS